MTTNLQELLARVRDPDAVVRGRAAEDLATLGGDEAISALLQLQQDPDMIVRFKAAIELAWMGNDRGVEVLVWALGRRDLCFLALEALAEIPKTQAVMPVRRFFHKWFLHPLERLQASAVLARWGDPEGEQFLRDSLQSRRPEERGFALELWGKLRMPGALELLQTVLANESDGQRLDAVRGLGHLRDERALPFLDRLSREVEDDLLAETARETADWIRQRTPG